MEVNGHKAIIYNVTDSTTLVDGASARAPSGSGMSDSIVIGRFTIATTKTICLLHYTSTSIGSYGLGAASSTLGIEVYSVLKISKVA
jgi:hypothetical protein